MASASVSPSISPSRSPSVSFSASPSLSPSRSFSSSPSKSFSSSPSLSPSKSPSSSPSASPSIEPQVPVLPDGVLSASKNVKIWKWSLRLANDSGKPVDCVGYVAKSVQAVGNFDGMTITMQGSLMIENPTWASLTTDGGSTACSLTTAGIKKIAEDVYQIRPIVTGSVPELRADIYLIMEKR